VPPPPVDVMPSNSKRSEAIGTASTGAWPASGAVRAPALASSSWHRAAASARTAHNTQTAAPLIPAAVVSEAAVALCAATAFPAARRLGPAGQPSAA
jgi:hypothetical protein